MTSIDERIKQELESEETALDMDFADSKGLNDMVWDAYRAGPKRWMTLVGVIMVLLTGVLIYLLYRFVQAEVVLDKVEWGVWSVIAIITIIALELWSWMQVNRVSTMREIKQMELSIRRCLEKGE